MVELFIFGLGVFTGCYIHSLAFRNSVNNNVKLFITSVKAQFRSTPATQTVIEKSRNQQNS